MRFLQYHLFPTLFDAYNSLIYVALPVNVVTYNERIQLLTDCFLINRASVNYLRVHLFTLSIGRKSAPVAQLARAVVL